MIYGPDLEAYIYLTVKSEQWWCPSIFLEVTFYFDCYCPFGSRSRSMPAEFQRLSDALRVIMTRRPVEVQLGVLDDFTGIVHRKKDETGG